MMFKRLQADIRNPENIPGEIEETFLDVTLIRAR